MVAWGGHGRDEHLVRGIARGQIETGPRAAVGGEPTLVDDRNIARGGDPRIYAERHEAVTTVGEDTQLQLNGIAFGDAGLAVDEVHECGVLAVGDANGGVGSVVVFDDDLHVLAVKEELVVECIAEKLQYKELCFFDLGVVYYLDAYQCALAKSSELDRALSIIVVVPRGASVIT